MKSKIEPEMESDHSLDWEYGEEEDDDRDLRREILDSQRKRNSTSHEPLPDDVVYDDDYTESTASSGSISMSASTESIEQFKNSVRSASTNTSQTNVRQQPVNDELETYHPRMEVRALSPYRSPEPGQATIILNKPVPLPDPDIKPKSILKRRTSNENNANDIAMNIALTKEMEKETANALPPPQTSQPLQQPTPQIKPMATAQPTIQSRLPSQAQAQQQLQSQLQQPQPQPKSLPSTPKPEKEKRSFLNLFGKKTTSAENSRKPNIEPPQVIEKNVPEKATGKEKLKTRQDSVEENKVEQVAVIDHYSDIVREMGSRSNSRPNSRPPSRTSFVPLYMNNQALRDATMKAEEDDDDDEHELDMEQPQNEPSQYMSPEVHKMNIHEDEDAQFMLEVAKKMNLYMESNEREMVASPSPPPPSSPSQNDLVEISVEHTKSVSYAVRQIKQPDVSATNNATTPMVFQANAKTLTESTKLSGGGMGGNRVIDTKKQDTLTKVKSSSRSLARKSISEQRQRSQSKSPVRERKTSLSSTVLKVTRMPIENANNDIDIDLQPDSKSPASSSSSPEPRCKTPEQRQSDAELELNTRSTLNFTINMIMFLMACWVYVFYDARFAIPFLLVMVYRYVSDVIVTQWQKWTKRKEE